MRRLLILALCALAATPAFSAGLWTRASSDHFEIYTTSGDRRAREALAYFERVYAFFFQQPNLLSPRLTRPIRLVVFSNVREFRPYRPYESAVAYYRSSLDRDYIVMQSFGPDAYAVVAHEFVHMILARSNLRYPVWLSEGLAEYYSTVSLLGTLGTVGRAPENRLQDLTDGGLLPLDRLFAVTRDAEAYRTSEHAGPYYAQSWALTHMLLSHDRYRAGSGRLFALLRNGTADTASAFRTVYARSVREVEGDLTNYLRDGRFVERTTRYRPPPRRGEVPAAELPAFQSDLALANLLAAGREDRVKAQAAFEQLARLRPDDLALLESRALFEMRSGRSTEARKYFARAVELGSNDAPTYRQYAALVGASDPALVERLLRRAVALEPADVATRVILGNLIAARDPAGVLATLEPVTARTPPGAFDVYRLRTNAYIALNRLEPARDSALDLVRVAAGRQQRTLATRLLASVEAALAVQLTAQR